MSKFTNNDIDIAPPIGSIAIYTGINDPDGWLICDGRTTISRIFYSNLFNVIGTTYGNGDGSLTFTLPDLRNKFIRGTSIVNNSIIGNDSVTLSINNLPAHTHTLANHTHTIPQHNHTMANHTHTIPGHSHGYFDAFNSETIDGGRNDQQGNYRGYVSGTTTLYFRGANTSEETPNTGGPSTNTGDNNNISSANNNNTDSTGSTNSFSIQPACLSMNYIIKY